MSQGNQVHKLQLLPIDQSGGVALLTDVLPDFVGENCIATAAFYRMVGFQPPWFGYISTANGRPVGGGGFKSPPQANRVEIAYHTLPEMEGQGFASSTARELISMARRAVPETTISAQTLPTLNSSNALLKKLGFTFYGALFHPEDGDVWEWQLCGPPT